MLDEFRFEMFILFLISLDWSSGSIRIITRNGKDSHTCTLSECCVRCASRQDCQSFTYSTENTTCVLQGDVLDPQLLLGLKKYFKKQLQNCSSRMTHFKFSRYKIQITTELKRETKSPPAAYINKGPRILLVSNTREQDSYQMSLSNMSHVSPYNHLKRQDVSALVYLHASKKLLLSNKRKNKIYAYSLDSERYSVLVSNHSTDHFGLDESRGLVFFYSKQEMSKTGYIVRMMYDGSNVTLIKSLRGRVSRTYVMVDIKNQRLYMNIEYHFTNVYTYLGDEVGHLFANIPSLKDIHVIAFDQRNLWLYHVEDRTLSKVSLKDKRQTEISIFKRNPRQVVLYGRKLFVAVPRISKLYVVDQTNQVKEFWLKFKSYDDWNICVV